MNLTAGNFKIGGSPAGSGAIRLQNNNFIGWLNAAGNGQFTFGLNSSDNFVSSGNMTIANAYGMVIGHSAQVVTGHTAEFQILGTSAPDLSLIHISEPTRPY